MKVRRRDGRKERRRRERTRDERREKEEVTNMSLLGVIASGPPFYVLLAFLIAPFVWAIPEAFITAELSAAIPCVGGNISQKYVREKGNKM